VRKRDLLLSISAMIVTVVVAWQLQAVSYIPGPRLIAYLQIASGLLAFALAANTLVRFRGTGERTSLVLAVGFLLSAVVTTGSSFEFFGLAASQNAVAVLRAPAVWWVSRMLLAFILIAALLVEKHLSEARFPMVEIAGAVLMVAGISILLAVFHSYLPSDLVANPGGMIPRPFHLLPAAIFLLAAIGYHRRLRRTASMFDLGLFLASLLNLGSLLASSQSDRLLDATFIFSQLLAVAGFAAAFAGAFQDEANLFNKVQRMAITDPLTGLGNYRHMETFLTNEIQRSGRLGHPFSILLIDMDSLKTINDLYGHLVGTRAIRRLSEILKQLARSIDALIRYGGDEFVVVLPETGKNDAVEVAERISRGVQMSQEHPSLSVSIGVAAFPDEGTTLEQLLSAADKDLYRMKAAKKLGPALKADS
jgi:diguanylate cyclase (GGDEF)-like protein